MVEASTKKKWNIKLITSHKPGQRLQVCLYQMYIFPELGCFILYNITGFICAKNGGSGGSLKFLNKYINLTSCSFLSRCSATPTPPQRSWRTWIFQSNSSFRRPPLFRLGSDFFYNRLLLPLTWGLGFPLWHSFGQICVCSWSTNRAEFRYGILHFSFLISTGYYLLKLRDTFFWSERPFPPWDWLFNYFETLSFSVFSLHYNCSKAAEDSKCSFFLCFYIPI